MSLASMLETQREIEHPIVVDVTEMKRKMGNLFYRGGDGDQMMICCMKCMRLLLADRKHTSA